MMPWWLPLALAFGFMAFYAYVMSKERKRKEREAAWRKKYGGERDKPS